MKNLSDKLIQDKVKKMKKESLGKTKGVTIENKFVSNILKSRSLPINKKKITQSPIYYKDDNGERHTYSIFTSLKNAIYDKAGSKENGDKVIQKICLLVNNKCKKENIEGRVKSALIREACFYYILDEHLKSKYVKNKN